MALYKNNKELVDDCVRAFFTASDSALTQARGYAEGFDGITAEQATQNARLVWSALQRAKLFCVEPEQWMNMYHSADRYTTDLAGLEWVPGREKVYEAFEDIDINLYCRLWGVTRKEAAAKGYFRTDGVMDVPNFKGLEPLQGVELKATGTIVSQAGWDALAVSLARLPEEKKQQLHKSLSEYMIFRRTADPKKDRVVLVEMSEDITKTLFNETPEDTERLLNVYENFGVHWPFPSPLPFDSCFFCFGQRFDLSLSPVALHCRIRPEQLATFTQPEVYFVGYLLAWEGEVPYAFTVFKFGKGKEAGGGFGFIRTYEDDEWTQPMSLDPWILSSLVRSVNEHKHIIQDYRPTLTNRVDRKQASKPFKQLLPMPSPFYMLNLTDELISQPSSKPKMKAGRPVEWTHRWDVRGHECVRIERGEQPLPVKEVARLKARGYRIYEGMSLTAEDAGRLLKRGVRAPGPHEWIAVLSYWREACVKGPEGRPYVPAARVGA